MPVSAGCECLGWLRRLANRAFFREVVDGVRGFSWADESELEQHQRDATPDPEDPELPVVVPAQNPYALRDAQPISPCEHAEQRIDTPAAGPENRRRLSFKSLSGNMKQNELNGSEVLGWESSTLDCV